MEVDVFLYPTVMSKMLEPTELDTAMSPRPFLATITLVIRSGIEVPAANMVRPMISSVIQNVSPTWRQKIHLFMLQPHSLETSWSQKASIIIVTMAFKVLTPTISATPVMSAVM